MAGQPILPSVTHLRQGLRAVPRTVPRTAQAWWLWPLSLAAQLRSSPRLWLCSDNLVESQERPLPIPGLGTESALPPRSRPGHRRVSEEGSFLADGSLVLLDEILLSSPRFEQGLQRGRGDSQPLLAFIIITKIVATDSQQLPRSAVEPGEVPFI